mgnify:CR=1 FL=1
MLLQGSNARVALASSLGGFSPTFDSESNATLSWQLLTWWWCSSQWRPGSAWLSPAYDHHYRYDHHHGHSAHGHHIPPLTEASCKTSADGSIEKVGFKSIHANLITLMNPLLMAQSDMSMILGPWWFHGSNVIPCCSHGVVSPCSHGVEGSASPSSWKLSTEGSRKRPVALLQVLRRHFPACFVLLEPCSLHFLGPLGHQKSVQRCKSLIVREENLATERLENELAESGPCTLVHLLPSIIQLTAFACSPLLPRLLLPLSSPSPWIFFSLALSNLDQVILTFTMSSSTSTETLHTFGRTSM